MRAYILLLLVFAIPMACRAETKDEAREQVKAMCEKLSEETGEEYKYAVGWVPHYASGFPDDFPKELLEDSFPAGVIFAIRDKNSKDKIKFTGEKVRFYYPKALVRGDKLDPELLEQLPVKLKVGGTYAFCHRNGFISDISHIKPVAEDVLSSRKHLEAICKNLSEETSDNYLYGEGKVLYFREQVPPSHTPLDRDHPNPFAGTIVLENGAEQQIWVRGKWKNPNAPLEKLESDSTPMENNRKYGFCYKKIEDYYYVDQVDTIKQREE